MKNFFILQNLIETVANSHFKPQGTLEFEMNIQKEYFYSMFSWNCLKNG